MCNKSFGWLFLVVMLHLSPDLSAATFDVATPTEFQSALTTAQANGEDDTINVQAGTYNVSTTLAYITTEKHSLTIIGENAATTIIDGGNSVQPINLASDNGGDISISGLTCRNGRNTAGEGPVGGGMSILCSGTPSATVNACVFSNNYSDGTGGGLWVGFENGNATITSCTANGNSTGLDDGGGIYVYNSSGSGNISIVNCNCYDNHLYDNPEAVGGISGAGLFIYYLGEGGTITIDNNTIADNSAETGVGGFFIRVPISATLIVSDNRFSDNVSNDTSEVLGGGAHLHMENGTMRVRNNQFLNNRTIGTGPGAGQGDGGGLGLGIWTSGALEMTGNVFVGNRCDRHGGGATINIGDGITQANIVDNLFANNLAGDAGSGGGLQINSNSDVTLVNNTFYNNTADSAGGLGYYAENADDTASLFNEVYWGNTPNSISVTGNGAVLANYSNIDGGTGRSYFGTGCIDTNPLFFNAANPAGADGIYATGDDGLHLTDASPSRNTGNTAFVPGNVTTDIAGASRIQNSAVDMGAYEGAVGSTFDVNIVANGQQGPVIVTPTDPLSIQISIYPGDRAGETADLWIVVKTPFTPPADWYSYVYPSGWESGIHLCVQVPLFSVSPLEVLHTTLPVGNYRFTFAVDDPDGRPVSPWWGMNWVDVVVQ